MNLEFYRKNWFIISGIEPFDVDSSIDVRQLSKYTEYVFQSGIFKAVAGLRGDYFSEITDYGISPRLGYRIDMPRIWNFFGPFVANFLFSER